MRSRRLIVPYLYGKYVIRYVILVIYYRGCDKYLQVWIEVSNNFVNGDNTIILLYTSSWYLPLLCLYYTTLIVNIRAGFISGTDPNPNYLVIPRDLSQSLTSLSRAKRKGVMPWASIETAI